MTHLVKGQTIANLKDLRHILVDKDYKVKSENARCAVELSLIRKDQAMFFKVMENAKGDLERVKASWRTIQISMYAKLALAVKYVLEGWRRRPCTIVFIFGC